MPQFKKPASLKERINFKYIGNGFYIVRTQAGFRQAFRAYLGVSEKAELRGYPKSYPAIVSFSEQYAGYIYHIAKCIPFNELKTAMSESDKVFKEHTLKNLQHDKLQSHSRH